ncbi:MULTISPECIES: DUF3108 domain-containing protein [unclassified Hyphomicrobium]|uniref:DUF3108 domain-containing protein n=1 Tax=unclassified Hyphomicrobium TaxID=2619925 RepID=UPI000213DDB4|nr:MULTISPECIES: DUF3108 domain-containing protein [unclassified Hyphomicrobium]CCB67618.1 conserved exported protein of unknown function [Hyphomicrobium sp. MC1]
MAISGAGARRRGAFCSLFAVAAATFPLESASAIGPNWPTEVVATYKLAFAGFDVGAYQFNAHFNNGTYDAQAHAKVSAFFGAFKWAGNFSGKGALEPSGLRPAAFEMSYKKKKKFVSVKIGFAGRAVTAVALVPNKPPSPDTIKLKPENLKNVFDPMAAMISISDANPSDACNRVIPVFDGKARYDLHFTFKGREPLTERRPSGQPKELIVCRVKYVPIAGHKPKDFTDPWIDYNNIEFALRAVPRAGIYVPYRVTIPSPIGNAVMTANTINITSANNQQIALTQ